MTNCPKCRSYRIAGPIYSKAEYGRENLIYTCMGCGFKSYEATADADAESRERLPFDSALRDHQ